MAKNNLGLYIDLTQKNNLGLIERKQINGVAVVYHQATGKYTLMRDEIQRRLAAFDDIHRTSHGDDIPSLRLG